MHGLREVQHCVMQALVLRSDGAEAASLLRCGDAVSAQRRLQVYRNNLFEIRIAALGAVYPVIERLVGTAFFRCMARAYIQVYPSRSSDLHEFGGRLPDFLRDYIPAEMFSYLVDVAELEWACHRAYHGVWLPAIDVTGLARLSPADPAESRLQIQPSVTVIRSRFPLLRIWRANQPQTADDDGPISLDEGGVQLLVMQRDLEVEFLLLDEAESLWLCAVAAGDSLADATEQALDRNEGFDLGAVLARHLARGLFVDGRATWPGSGERDVHANRQVQAGC
jgi:hypothetical protein